MDPSSNKTIIFKCDRHAANISERLLSFYEENEFFDTVLIAGSDGVEIQAHKIVLSALSDYFLETFRASFKASSSNVIQLKEIEALPLKSLVECMYSGWIEMSLENVEGLLRTASVLKMKSVVDGCCDFIEKHLNKNNCLNRLRLARELNLSGLKEKSLNCTYTHFEEVSKERDFFLLNEEEVRDLLFNDNPHGDFEEHVFFSLVAWIEYDEPNREHLTFQLLSMVRYQYLTPKFIIGNRKPVCKTVESYELIFSWLQWHLSPETRSKDERNRALKPRKVQSTHAVRILDSERIEIQNYNTKLDTWSVEKEIQLCKKKSVFSTIVIDKKLIVVGGRTENKATNSVECFDLDTSEWTNLPLMRRARINCLLENINGQLCVFCGLDENSEVLDSMELFNFSSQKWEYVQLLYKPSKDSRISTHNGILYIVDFENGFLQTYDALSAHWTAKCLQKEKLSIFGFAEVGGFLYVIGGRKQGVYVETVKRYDVSNETWCEVEPLPLQNPSFEIMITKVFGNKIVVGGESLGKIVFVEYDTNTNSWKNLGLLSSSDWVSTLYYS